MTGGGGILVVLNDPRVQSKDPGIGVMNPGSSEVNYYSKIASNQILKRTMLRRSLFRNYN